LVLKSPKQLRGDLNDGRAGGDGVVGDKVLAASQDNVGLAGEALGDLDGEAALDGGGLDEGGAGDGDEGGVDLVALEGVVLFIISAFPLIIYVQCDLQESGG
jgi:hypothetical protein